MAKVKIACAWAAAVFGVAIASSAVLWFFGLGLGAVANKLQFGTYGECA